LQRCAVDKETGHAAFVRQQMVVRVADDPVIRFAQTGERKTVRGCAVEDEEDVALGLEEFPDELGRAPSTGRRRTRACGLGWRPAGRP
jgi:hypothetical protein